MEEKKIDWSQYRRVFENEEVARQHGMPQNVKEANPTFFERKQEQENRSGFSGGVWGGRQDRSR
jgi:hypothetical protein